MIMQLLSAAPPTPWWQTALISLIPALGGAAVALLGVWLNGLQTTKREASKAEADGIAQQLSEERAVIGDLIAETLPWVAGVRTQFLAAWFAVHPHQGKRLREGLWEESIQGIERFAGSLWRARVTVRNPLARPALDELTDLYSDTTEWLDTYESTHNHNDHAQEDARVDGLRARVDAICRALEAATLGWDGTDPQKVASIPATRSSSGVVDDLESDVSH